MSDQTTDWVNQHSYHPATAKTAPLHDKIRQDCIDLAYSIDRCVPPGFEHDKAQEALQLVRMWSNAGIAIRLAEKATQEQRAVPNDPFGQDQQICMSCGGSGGTNLNPCITCLGSGCRHHDSQKKDTHCSVCEQDDNCSACRWQNPVPKPDASETEVFEPPAPEPPAGVGG